MDYFIFGDAAYMVFLRKGMKLGLVETRHVGEW